VLGHTPTSYTENGNTYYIITDHLGSPREIVESNGTILKTIDYDSFGNVIADSNPTLKIPFGFAGGLQDNDTGLVRFGYRDYDPSVGRWTARDPIGFAGGDTNLYGYVFSDPVNFVDLLGLEIEIVGGPDYSTDDVSDRIKDKLPETLVDILKKADEARRKKVDTPRGVEGKVVICGKRNEIVNIKIFY
jgi:RHS repeat-associated protein